MPVRPAVPAVPVTPAAPAMWHPLLSAVFEAFEAASVSWCLLRVPSEPAAPSGDVDLLVAARHRARLPAVLEPLGLVRVPNAGTPDEFYLAYDADTDCWVWLHITSELSFGPGRGLATGAASGCLARRVQNGGVRRLTADDEFWVTVLHALIDKDELSDRYRATLPVLARAGRAEGPLAAVVDAHAPAGWSAAAVLDGVRAGRWAELRSFADAVRARSGRSGPARAAAERVTFLLRLARGIGNPWRRRGITVAILGPDGAGKSTLAAGLRQTFFFPSTSFYMDVKTEELRGVARWHVPGLTFLTYLATLWGRLAAARWHQARGELVLFDRYSYDALTSTEPPADRAKALARWVHTRLFPGAGLALVLDVSGSTMFSRKGERTPADLDRERRRWLTLAERIPAMRIIDASQPADRVRREATALVWAQYAARWATGAAPGRPASTVASC